MLNKGWIDIHAHVLPGVDDGARDWEESRALLKLAYDQGIRDVYKRQADQGGSSPFQTV